MTQWSNKVPKEIYMHQLIERHRDDGHRHIIRYRAHRLFMKQKIYRVYLDYLPGGSLEREFERIARMDLATKTNIVFPEEYIWYYFRVLTDALQVFYQGNLHHPIHRWRSLIHKDIRPDNIFLGLDPGNKPNRQEVSHSSGQSYYFLF